MDGRSHTHLAHRVRLSGWCWAESETHCGQRRAAAATAEGAGQTSASHSGSCTAAEPVTHVRCLHSPSLTIPVTWSGGHRQATRGRSLVADEVPRGPAALTLPGLPCRRPLLPADGGCGWWCVWRRSRGDRSEVWLAGGCAADCQTGQRRRGLLPEPASDWLVAGLPPCAAGPPQALC